MDDEELKRQIIYWKGFKNPEITSKSPEELIMLVYQIEAASMPPNLADDNSQFLQNIDYICLLQSVANAHGTNIFSKSSLFHDLPDYYSMVNRLCPNDDAFKRMMKHITRYEIASSQIESLISFSEDDWEQFRCVEDFSKFVDELILWKGQETGQEVGYFQKNIKNNLSILTTDEQVSDLAAMVNKYAAGLRKHDISREGFFSDFLGRVSNTFHGLDQFEEGCIWLMGALKMKKVKTSKEYQKVYSQQFQNRYAYNYYRIFDTLGKLPALTQDLDGLKRTFETLTSFFEKLVNPEDYVRHMHDSGSTENFMILQYTGKAFKSPSQLERMLKLLEDIKRSIGEERSYLSLCFSPSRQKHIYENLPTAARIIEYTKLIRKAVRNKTFQSSMFYKTMLDYIDLARNAPEVRRVGEAVFAINEHFLDRGMDSYEIEKVYQSKFSTFRPLISSIDELEGSAERLYKIIRYSGKHGFVRWQEDEFCHTMKNLISASDNLESLERNLHRMVRHAGRTKSIIDTERLIHDVIPLFAGIDNYQNLKSSISTVQKSLRRWNRSGYDVDALIDGFVSMNMPSADERLATIDACLEGEDKKLAESTFRYINHLGKRNQKEEKTGLEYQALFSDIKGLVASSEEGGFDLRSIRIGTSTSEDINERMFYSSIEEISDLVRAGLVPSSEVVSMYKQMDRVTKKDFIRSIQMAIENFTESRKFDMENIIERYAVFVTSRRKGADYITFKSFSKVCENYRAGKPIALEYESTEMDIIEKYAK